MRQRVEDLGRIYKIVELCFDEPSTRGHWKDLDEEAFRISHETVLEYLEEIFEIAGGTDTLNRENIADGYQNL